MTKRNILFLISEALVIILSFIGNAMRYYDNVLLNYLGSLFLIIFFINFIWTIFFFKKRVRKEQGKIIENIYPYFENKNEDEALIYLSNELNKTFIPSVTKLIYAYIVLINISKNNLNEARKYLKNKWIRHHILLFNHRILIALYDNNLSEAKEIYDKYEKIVNKLNGEYKIEYSKSLNICSKFIKMCETKIFDEELYELVTLDYTKELCLRFKND